MSYSFLWFDVVNGLIKEGWENIGGNDTDFLLMRKEDKEIKVFLHDYNNLKHTDINFVCVRYT